MKGCYAERLMSRARVLVFATAVVAAACANVAGLTGGGADESDAGDASGSPDVGSVGVDGGKAAGDGSVLDATSEAADSASDGEGGPATDAMDSGADAPQDAARPWDATTFLTEDGGGNDTVRGLAISGGYLYWTDREYPVSRIRRAPLDGGPAVTLATSDVPQEFVIDANYIYWIDSTAGTLQRAPFDGGASTTLGSATQYSAGLALDGNMLVWGDHVTGTVAAMLIDGGSPHTVTTVAALNQVNAADGTVYIAAGQYATDGGILQVPVAGGTAMPLSAGLQQPQNITVTPTMLYVTGGWNAYYACTVARPDGATTRLDTGNALQFTGYEWPGLDANYVYTASYPGMARVPRAGGAPRFFSGANTFTDFAIDASGLYWVEVNGREIKHAAPLDALWQ